MAALEMLITTLAVRNLIREGKTHQISFILKTRAKIGMQSMNMSIRDLTNSEK